MRSLELAFKAAGLTLVSTEINSEDTMVFQFDNHFHAREAADIMNRTGTWNAKVEKVSEKYFVEAILAPSRPH